MPYVHVDPDIFLSHEGVDVFHTYDPGKMGAPTSYWFTTDPSTADDCHSHGTRGHFDVRAFARLGEITPTVAAWEGWWKPRFRNEDDAINALIKTEIDEGRLPRKGTATIKESIAIEKGLV